MVIKRQYKLIIDSTLLDEAKNLGRSARLVHDSVACNPYWKNSEQWINFLMGYYEKDCAFGKTNVE